MKRSPKFHYRFPEATEREIVRRYLAGETTTKLQRDYPTSRQTLKNILKRHGVMLRPPRIIPPVMRDEVLRLYRGGVSYKEIEQRTNVSSDSIQKIARRAGEPTRDPSVTKREAKRIIARYQSRETITSIATGLGRNRNTVAALLHRSGVTVRRSGWSRRVLTAKQHLDILKRRRAGEKLISLAKSFGVSDATILNYLKRPVRPDHLSSTE